VPSVEVFSPAKLNLFLAVTGRRSDGFHDLVSVVTPVRFGDKLKVELVPGGGLSLACEEPALPRDETNLILRAARLFVEALGRPVDARFILEKRIPMGAGLGGGSSNAVATLLALNRLTGHPLSRAALSSLSAKLGSDCALFLHDAPVVMRGRGERIEPLATGASSRLSGRRVLIFKPSFGIATAWAYARMAAGAPESYLSAPEAEAKVAVWLASAEPAEKLIFNNMERPAFAKYVALPTLLERLRSEFGLAVAMSGSGSACFALLRDDVSVAKVRACIQEGWGQHAFVMDTEIV